jgi:hypothetical protein
MMTKEICVIECNTRKGGLEFLLKSQINQISDFSNYGFNPIIERKREIKGHTHLYL